MASTIYYGKSETPANTQVKRVVMEEVPNFQPGDILSVYFTYGNSFNGPTLVVTNGDVNQNNAISNDTGLSILAPGQGTAVIGSWTDGEVVNFSYTEVPNNVFYWELIGKSIATDTIYGGVLLDATGDNENNSAISVSAAKRLLSSAAVGSISYETRQFETATEVGDLTLTTYNPVTGDTDTQTATIVIPHDATYPPISQITNDAGYISESSTAVTSGILFKSENNSNDTLRVGDSSDSSTVINLNNNGNLTLTPVNGNTVINSGLTVNGVISGTFNATAPSTIPNLTVDTINVTSNGSGLSVSGNTHLQGNTIIDSLNIGNTPLSDYMYDEITDNFLSQAYRIFKAGGNQHVRWTWHRGRASNIAAGKFNSRIDLGDCGLKGYRTVGVISWECYHKESDNGTAPYQANLYGFYWEKSETTGLSDHLYAKVYNCGSTPITNLWVSALVLLLRDDPFNIIDMSVRITRPIIEDDEIIGEEDILNKVTDKTGEFGFNIEICEDWSINGMPTTIYINGTSFSGENIDTFMNDIYTTLYIVEDNTRPIGEEVSTTIEYLNTTYKLSCTLSNPYACWFDITTI